MLLVNTSFNKWRRNSVWGSSPAWRERSSALPTALRASSRGTLVYSEVTSNVTKREGLWRTPNCSSKKIKWPVSFTYDLIAVRQGWSKWSKNCEILSVGLFIAETMGRPGGGGVRSLYVFWVEGKIDLGGLHIVWETEKGKFFYQSLYYWPIFFRKVSIVKEKISEGSESNFS